MIPYLSTLKADTVIIKKVKITYAPGNLVKTTSEGRIRNLIALTYFGAIEKPTEIFNPDGSVKPLDTLKIMKDTIVSPIREIQGATFAERYYPSVFKVTSGYDTTTNPYAESETIESGEEIQCRNFANECLDYQFGHAFIQIDRFSNEVRPLPTSMLQNANEASLRRWGVKN